jgi:hypothetical protein
LTPGETEDFASRYDVWPPIGPGTRNPVRVLADNSVDGIIGSLLRFDLINCDELGFVPLDDHDTQLLFRFVAGPTSGAGSASHRTGDRAMRSVPA